MFRHNLFKGTEVRQSLGHVVAGTSVQAGTPIDTFGYQGVAFVVSYGALTATQVTNAKAQGGLASNGSDAADLAGSHTTALLDTQSATLQVIDIYRPAYRYITPVVNRGTANAEILGVTAILYNAEIAPPQTLDATNASAPVVLSYPLVGTA
jgi:hypothetical protein